MPSAPSERQKFHRLLAYSSRSQSVIALKAIILRTRLPSISVPRTRTRQILKSIKKERLYHAGFFLSRSQFSPSHRFFRERRQFLKYGLNVIYFHVDYVAAVAINSVLNSSCTCLCSQLYRSIYNKREGMMRKPYYHGFVKRFCRFLKQHKRLDAYGTGRHTLVAWQQSCGPKALCW